MNINLYINKQSARAEAPEIFSGAVGVLTVTLFGELDSSLIPVLRFMHESGEGYYTAKIEHGCALVPHEVIQAPGFSIAVAGYENDGEEVKRFLPSEAVYIPVKENGYGNPDDAVSEEEESRSLIGQILSECQSVKGEVSDAKNALSRELSDAKDEMSDDILFTKEELERKYNDAKNKLDAMEGMLHEEESVRYAADKALSDALVAEVQNRAEEDAKLSGLIGDKADKVDLSNYVQKEKDKGLSYIKHIGILDMYEETDDGENSFKTLNVVRFGPTSTYGETIEKMELYNKDQIDKKLSELPSGGGGADLSNYYTKAEVDADLKALNDEVLNIKYDMPLKQDIVNVSYRIDEPNFVYNFGYTHNTDTRLEDAYVTSISFEFNNKVYVDEYISGLSFVSGETPTRIDYTNSGILNWVGTDCSDNNGYSIFKPEPNKHYDIVFYYNGRQFIGLVNGFVPSLGNVVA